MKHILVLALIALTAGIGSSYAETAIHADLPADVRHLFDHVDMVPTSDRGRAALDALAGQLIPIGDRPLSEREAAFVAARLANLACLKSFLNRPFDWRSFDLIPNETGWRWGQLDPAGVHGFSAEVILQRDGSEVETRVYFSHDATFPGQIFGPIPPEGR